MSSIGEVFPADDRISRFVVAMCIAANDVQHAVDRARATPEADDPARSYYMRVAIAHQYEGVAALRQWRQIKAIRDYLSKLSPEGQEALTRACSTEQKIGAGAQEHARHHTLHYPAPSYETELEEALKAMAGQEAVIELSAERPFRFGFADRVAEQLVFAKHAQPGDPRLDKQLATALEGAIAFTHFVGALVEAYSDDRELSL